MDDSIASPVRVSEYKSMSWIFKCISWQYDRLLDRCQFKRRSWNTVCTYCNASDPNGKPPDIIVIQFRYKTGGSHVLPVNFWIRKDAVVGNEMDSYEKRYQMSEINSKLAGVFEKMIPECNHVKSDLIREVIDVAQTLASMPRNVGREGLSFVYEVSALPALFKVAIDSLARKFVDDVANLETQVCAICLDDISKGDEVIWMPCSHIYHGECILRWLEKKPTCPMCLMALPMDSC